MEEIFYDVSVCWGWENVNMLSNIPDKIIIESLQIALGRSASITLLQYKPCYLKTIGLGVEWTTAGPSEPKLSGCCVGKRSP